MTKEEEMLSNNNAKMTFYNASNGGDDNCIEGIDIAER